MSKDVEMYEGGLLPLDDAENSARWIEEQDVGILLEELERNTCFLMQCFLALNHDEYKDYTPEVVEDLNHSCRLHDQLIEGLRKKTNVQVGADCPG